MIQLPRRYFFNSRNEKHYNKKWGRTMELQINPEERNFEVEELIGIKISLINALEQLDLLIDSMSHDCTCDE
jgi:hypothetical protein